MSPGAIRITRITLSADSSSKFQKRKNPYLVDWIHSISTVYSIYIKVMRTAKCLYLAKLCLLFSTVFNFLFVLYTDNLYGN